jgi:predicted secreted hydrolase
MTHLAVSDPDGRRYRFDERLSRAGPGLAGAESDRYRVWNDDWTGGLDDRGRHVLRAASAQAAVDLVLDEGKTPAVNGVNGISQKGAQAGNASHYYSLTRMPTRGSVTIDGERFDVEGLSWMDHEFGTSFLEPGQQGWDWLAMQFEEGLELMLYQLRRSDGSRDPRSSGTLIERDGRTTHLAAGDFTLTRSGPTFKAPSGATYPIRWNVRVPGRDLTLDVTTPLENQELSTTGAGISYWEGAIDITGTARGKPITGRGYLEMTGYKGSLGRVLSGS